MEETVIVIMIKDKKTGFLEKELGCYKIEEYQDYIYNTFAAEEDGKYVVHIKLCCAKDVSDWEYEAIYDYYDTETISPFVTSITEDTEQYNPTWEVCFDFLESAELMEEKIGRLLRLHKQELDSVYEAIAGKRNEYTDEELD